MWWLFIVLLILVTLLIYLFFAPFYLEIDSRTGLFRFRFHRLATASVKVTDSYLIIDINVASWKKQIDLLNIKTQPAKKNVVIKTKAPGKKKPFLSLKKIIAILKTFKVNQCMIDLSFSDMSLNGILYPVFYLAGYYSKKRIGINFKGEELIVIQIQNNIARMLYAYLRS